MYIQAVSEKYDNTSKEIFNKLHSENKKENIILNTQFKECHFPYHTENLSLKFTFRGNEFYELGKKKVSVSPSNFLIVNQGQEHASWIESEDWVNSFAIYFSPEFATKAIDDLKVSDEKLLDEPFKLVNEAGSINFFQSLFPLNHGLVREVGLFKTYLEETNGTEPLLVDEQLRALFNNLIRQHQSELSCQMGKIAAVKASTRMEILRRLRIARDFIESFYVMKISCQDISKACFLSENLLLRHFKASFGVSPHQYIINKRLQFAREQLLFTKMSFNEITYSSGFECPSSFGRLFKERYGNTPNDLRKMTNAGSYNN